MLRYEKLENSGIANHSMSVSIGNDLKDSFKSTDKWINNGISWLGDVEEFYRERAALERDYATKLRELCKKHFDKKAKASARVSVGDEPIITPGSLESASLVLWTDVLTQTEAIADEKVKLSSEFSSKIGENISTLKAKTSKITKNIEAIHEFLEGERTKIEEEVNKAKKHYDSLCSNTESTRQKTEKSSSEKYQKRLQEKEVDMNIGKNEYLVKINIANRLKDKYYYQDSPELLDYFQVLNESKTEVLNKILKNANIVERNSNDRIKEKLSSIDTTIEANDPKLDTSMFIKHNLKDWKEPPDFYFIPSSIWHDDESLVTKEPELTELKKMLNKASIEYEKYEESALNSKQNLEESVKDRETERGNLTLKFDVKISNSLSMLNRFMQEDTQRVKNEVIIELIQNFASGKDLSYVEPTKVKKSRFGMFKKRDEDGGSDAHSLHTVNTSTSAHSHKTLGSTGIFNLRRNKSQAESQAEPQEGSGKALYAYGAAGPDETSIQIGDTFEVLEPDENGWTLIRNNGSQGLVPTSYISVSPKKGGAAPKVAPKRGAKRVQYVEALYDYTADGDDEISISAGDKIVLIQEDRDGSGWTEGEINGKKGLFPTSYIKTV